MHLLSTCSHSASLYTQVKGIIKILHSYNKASLCTALTPFCITCVLKLIVLYALVAFLVGKKRTDLSGYALGRLFTSAQNHARALLLSKLGFYNARGGFVLTVSSITFALYNLNKASICSQNKFLQTPFWGYISLKMCKYE